jgi:DNA-binding NarL/FixJ family response regulator
VSFSAVLDVQEVPQKRTVHSPAELAALSSAFPPGLRFCCIDDSLSSLRLLEFHIRRWCQPSEVHTFGSHEADVEVFLSQASRNADIVILDQHLLYSHEHLGTDLVRKLLARGYGGMVCIRSADDSAEDVALYARSGAHCSFGKDLLGQEVMEQLKAIYVQLRRSSQLLSATTLNLHVRDSSTSNIPFSTTRTSPQITPASTDACFFLPGCVYDLE